MNVRTASTRQQQDAGASQGTSSYDSTTATAGPVSLGLQQTVGNHAATQWLDHQADQRSARQGADDLAPLPANSPPPGSAPQFIRSELSSGGRPLQAEARLQMEQRFGYDLGDVRVHADGRAARSAQLLQASAYTVGSNIVFAPGEFAPAAAGENLLAHEIAHVVQQSRGSETPSLDSSSPLESEAEAAARQPPGNQPATVQGAAGVGLMRSVDDWLEGTPDIRTWQYTQIVDEIDEIEQWLGDQTSTSPEVIRMHEALTDLRREMTRRGNQALAPRRRKKKRRRGKGKRRGGALESEATETPQRRPRILRNRGSSVYANDEEVRAEINLIMAWLNRDDLPADEREILQAELLNLAPSLDASRVNKMANRRARKIETALTPVVEGDAREQLIAAVRVLDSIKPLPDQPDHSYLMVGDEMLVLHNTEVKSIRENVVKMMNQSVKKIQELEQSTFDKWSHQAKVNREEGFAAWAVSLFADNSDPLGPFDSMQAAHQAMHRHLSKYRTARRGQSLVGMAEALASAEMHAVKAKYLVDHWVEDIIVTAGKVVAGLTITRDLSFAIVGTYFGGAGFANLVRSGTGIARAGLTVASIGTVSTAAARGGSNVLGQALVGDVDIGEGVRETVAGAKQGLVNTTSGIVSAGTTSALGQGTTLSGRFVRGAASGGAGGFTAGGLDATLSLRSPEEIWDASWKGGLGGGIGGGFGGLLNPSLAQQSRSLRVFSGTLSGGGGAAATEAILGGSYEDIRRAAIIGAATGGVLAAHRTPTLHQRQRSAALRQEASKRKIEAVKLEQRAVGLELSRPDRAARMRQRAINLRKEAASFERQAREFATAKKSATEDLPGPEDVDEMFLKITPEGKIAGPTSVDPKFPSATHTPRLVRPLERGPKGGRMVYRVEGGGSKQLLTVTDDGNVKISTQKGAFLNFGSRARAEEFLAKRAPGARIVAFEVDEKWVQSVRSAAIPEQGTEGIRGPKLVDVRFANDQIYIPPDLIPELQQFVIPKSATIIKIKF